jgi:hypothetical protein
MSVVGDSNVVTSTFIVGKFYDSDNSKYNLSVFFYLAMQRYNYSLFFSSFYGVNNIIYYNNNYK